MPQTALILAQLIWLAFPAGWCTCARAEQSARPQVAACSSCKGECCRCREVASKSKPKAPGAKPCSDPNCPATLSASKSPTASPDAPAKAPPASTAKTVAPITGSRIAEHRPTDSLLLPTAYLFLIYGALLI